TTPLRSWLRGPAPPGQGTDIEVLEAFRERVGGERVVGSRGRWRFWQRLRSHVNRTAGLGPVASAAAGAGPGGGQRSVALAPGRPRWTCGVGARQALLGGLGIAKTPGGGPCVLPPGCGQQRPGRESCPARPEGPRVWSWHPCRVGWQPGVGCRVARETVPVPGSRIDLRNAARARGVGVGNGRRGPVT